LGSGIGGTGETGEAPNVSDGGGGGVAAHSVSFAGVVPEVVGSVASRPDSSPIGSFGTGMRVVGTGFWSVIERLPGAAGRGRTIVALRA
jgi:hypothetical protein